LIHLIHPAFVHFSIAFLVFGALSEAVGILGRRERIARFGNTLVLLGTATLPLALITGYMAANSLERQPVEAAALLWRHERNGWLVLGLFFGSQFWKAWNRGRLPGAQRYLYCVLVLGAAAFIVYSGYLGAEMVYGHGIGVSDAATGT